jgi:ribonuclease D
LRGDDDARLATGWRSEVMGQPIRDLVEGRAALAFEGDGRLVLEARAV